MTSAQLLLTKCIAYGLIIYAQLDFLVRLLQRRVTPHVLSWAGWGILMGISFIAQYATDGFSWNQASLLFSTIGCLMIAGAAWAKGQYTIARQDRLFFVLGLACILIYLLSKDQWITTALAILADLLMAIPTLKGAYRRPHEHRSVIWPLALLSWSLTMVVILHAPRAIDMLWPVYLLLFHGFLTYATFIHHHPSAGKG